MAFSTPPELRTFVALNEALAPLGYFVSQKTRVLDCVRAAAENPTETNPVGATFADQLLPALRYAAGPLGPDHPWLRSGDWRYAFSAHFDFVVHERLAGEHPTHPLFAVEFDGATTHATAETRRRDLAKNRLCAASGLPLVRIDDTFLQRREHLSLVEWLTRLWAAYRSEMPDLIAERDAAVEAMRREEIDAAGPWLLPEHPDLDVELVFRLGHPFPPAYRAAERLATRHGFHWAEMMVRSTGQQRWMVTSWLPAIPSLADGLVERWRCELRLAGPDGQTATVQGIADVQQGYPLDQGEMSDGWAAVLAGRLPYLPAGPWTTAPSVIGEALCVHNALIEVGHYLHRHESLSEGGR